MSPENRARHTIYLFYNNTMGQRLLGFLPRFSIAMSIPKFRKSSGLHAMPVSRMTFLPLLQDASNAPIVE
jgi:hypothetical protein